MRVVRHDKIRLRCDGAVAEYIVIRVRGDDAKTVLRFDLTDVGVKLIEQFQQRDYLPPAFRAGKFCRDLLIFEQNVVGNRQRELAIQQRAEDLMIRLLPPEDLEKDVGVEADRHA
jgi:hypothetical protein